MKVGNIPELSGADLPRHVPGTTGGVAPDKPVAEVADTDRVELSSASRLGQTIGQDGEIRAEKVTEVKNAIARGEFKIDVSAVADRMINEAASLVEVISAFESRAREAPDGRTNSQEKFGAGPTNARHQGPDR